MSNSNKYPKYSVLMSVYYKEKPEWLDFSVKSIMNQTIKCDEFVLVEDGPLNNKLDTIIEKYNKKFPGIFNIIKLEKNVGLGQALHIGVENCKNEYIARMDSDDYSVSNRIEKQLNLFLKDNELEIIGSNIVEFTGTIDNVVSVTILPEKHDSIIKFSKKRNPFRHPSVMFKKSAIMKAGNYREYYLCEDYDMWIRMIETGCKCYNIQENLVYMRISEDFYKRRGGHKYYKSIKKFKKEQLATGYFTKIEYVKSIVPHAIVCHMPNFMRNFVYRNMLRKKVNREER